MQLIDLLREQCELVQIKSTDVTYCVREDGGGVLNYASNGFEVFRALRDDQAELGQVAAQGIDQLCALTDQ